MQLHHDRPDPNRCPRCDVEDAIQELDRPTRWQPVTLGYDADGILAPETYPSTWDVSDDGTDTSYECRDCGEEWPNLYTLAAAQRLVHALRDHRDFWETRSERLKDLANADRLDTVTGAQRIEYADGMAHGFEHALAILRGNGEA